MVGLQRAKKPNLMPAQVIYFIYESDSYLAGASAIVD